MKYDNLYMYIWRGVLLDGRYENVTTLDLFFVLILINFIPYILYRPVSPNENQSQSFEFVLYYMFVFKHKA